jgi:hypothetical protein
VRLVIGAPDDKAMVSVSSSDVTARTLRAVAGAVGVFAGLIGVGGVALVLIGNDFISGGARTASLAALTVLAIAGAVLAWWRPVAAAVAMLLAAAGYVYSLSSILGGWWSAYQDAVRTSGAAENRFWLNDGGTPIALFLIAASLLVVAAALAALGHVRRGAGQRETDQRTLAGV